MRFKSRYCTEHFESFGSWTVRQLLTFWHSLPNRFVPALQADHDFAFVCGCGHSGTTLTAARLGKHSGILFLGRETFAFDPRYGALGAKRIAAEWDYFASIERKRLILEKTPKHVHLVDTIRQIIPTARFVITLRNPLDNVASLYRRFGDVDACIARWLSDTGAAARQGSRDDVLLVKYEDLTNAPTEQFSSIVDFIGLDWEQKIVESGDTPYDRTEQAGNMRLRTEQVSRPIQARHGIWRETLTAPEARRVVGMTEGLAAELGYDVRADQVGESSAPHS